MRTSWTFVKEAVGAPVRLSMRLEEEGREERDGAARAPPLGGGVRLSGRCPRGIRTRSGRDLEVSDREKPRAWAWPGCRGRERRPGPGPAPGPGLDLDLRPERRHSSPGAR